MMKFFSLQEIYWFNKRTLDKFIILVAHMTNDGIQLHLEIVVGIWKKEYNLKWIVRVPVYCKGDTECQGMSAIRE